MSFQHSLCSTLKQVTLTTCRHVVMTCLPRPIHAPSHPHPQLKHRQPWKPLPVWVLASQSPVPKAREEQGVCTLEAQWRHHKAAQLACTKGTRCRVLKAREARHVRSTHYCSCDVQLAPQRWPGGGLRVGAQILHLRSPRLPCRQRPPSRRHFRRVMMTLQSLPRTPWHSWRPRLN